MNHPYWRAFVEFLRRWRIRRLRKRAWQRINEAEDAAHKADKLEGRT